MPTSAVQWVPTAAGGMLLMQGSTTLLTVSASGAVSFNAAVTIGALRVQNMTGTERDNIVAPAAGMVVYNTTTNKLNVRVAAGWEAITSA